MKIHVLTGDLQLRPVIELAPSNFGKAPFPEPFTSAEGNHYWRECLAQSGIVGLNTVKEGSWLVYANDIPTPTPLQKIIVPQFKHYLISHDPDEVGILGGGYALMCSGDFVLLPRCCSDLGDLSSWKTAAEYRGQKPEMLWIGHPWLWVRYEDSMLVIQEDQKGGSPPNPRTLHVNPEALGAAVEQARHEVETFVERVRIAINALPNVPQSPRLAELLVGVDSLFDES